MERAHHTSTLWQVISDFGNPMVWEPFCSFCLCG